DPPRRCAVRAQEGGPPAHLRHPRRRPHRGRALRRRAAGEPVGRAARDPVAIPGGRAPARAPRGGARGAHPAGIGRRAGPGRRRRSPEMRRHVELYHAALRLMRAPDASAIGRELLAAAFARVPCDGGVLVAGPVPTGGYDLLAVRDVPEDALRDLLAAWDPAALAAGLPMAEGVLTFPSGGPFARAKGKAARLAAQTLAIPLAPIGDAAVTAALFLSKPRKERPEDRDLGRDLALLRAHA